MGRPSKHNTWCRHRTAFTDDHPVCEAGVDFHAFPKPWYGPDGVMPCLGETPEAKARCDKYAGYTPEEIAAAEAESNARFERMRVIRGAIIAEHEASGSSGGQMTCPACNAGTVSWSRARSNGHVHARCTTPGCASWME